MEENTIEVKVVPAHGVRGGDTGDSFCAYDLYASRVVCEAVIELRLEAQEEYRFADHASAKQAFDHAVAICARPSQWDRLMAVYGGINTANPLIDTKHAASDASNALLALAYREANKSVAPLDTSRRVFSPEATDGRRNTGG
ncbi:MAG: hypothetical protein KDD73_17180 [Anaerolineales bacterium]|nr:hypothetical protein [Anaerolineales bacterium]